MTFFVEKRLTLGSIRFGVIRRWTLEAIDDSPELSTGAGGEFIRRRKEGFYFGGYDRFNAPSLPSVPSIRSTPFWTSLTQHRGLLALAAAGALFILLGLAVVAKKGSQGLMEIALGIGMIAAPVALTAQERKKLREDEERVRTEREAIEHRNQEMLTAYNAALGRIQHDRSDDALQQLVNEHPDLPYNVWSPLARRTVLLIGFEELAKRGVARAQEVAQLMDRASRAAGLTPEHETGAKIDLYSAVVWHFLADDRLGPVQQDQLLALHNSFDILDQDIAEELKAIAEFERLRGMTTRNLPRRQCTTQLAFQEHCIHETKSDQGPLHITDKKLVVEGKKRREHSMPALSEITVLVDDSVVSVRDANEKKPLRLRVEDPIYTAAMIDLASSIDERPRGFA